MRTNTRQPRTIFSNTHNTQFSNVVNSPSSVVEFYALVGGLGGWHRVEVGVWKPLWLSVVDILGVGVWVCGVFPLRISTVYI